MLNFTVGPVQMSQELCDLGAEQVPYFRTPEFSKVMLENEQMLLSLAHAPEGSRAVFLTGSGTASMEAAVMHAFTPKDKVLVINGGSFGARFAQLCQVHGIPMEEVRLAPGQALRESHLAPFENRGFTGLLVNLCETSTGIRYPLPLLADFCQRNGCFFVADAISAFLADPVDMAACGIDMLLTGSQKALACPPGVSAVMMAPRAVFTRKAPGFIRFRKSRSTMWVLSAVAGRWRLTMSHRSANSSRGRYSTPYLRSVSGSFRCRA